MENKKFERKGAQLDDVSAGFLDGLFGVADYVIFDLENHIIPSATR